MDNSNKSIFFVDKLEPILVCNNRLYEFTGSVFRKPTDFTRIKNDEHNLEGCKDCQKNYEIIFSNLKSRFDDL